MNPKVFFSELKRRNVYKVAVAYAVIAWLLIQAAPRGGHAPQFSLDRLNHTIAWFNHTK